MAVGGMIVGDLDQGHSARIAVPFGERQIWAVMVMTRRVDWYRIGEPTAS